MAEEAAEPSPHPPPTVILSLFLSFIFFFFFPDLGLYKKWETDRIWIKFVVN